MLEDEHEECEPRPSLFPVVLATAGSLVVGYLFGRDRFRKDLLRAMDRAEQSPDPVEIHIREGL